MELTLKNILVSFSGKEVLNSINLTVEDGTFTSLLGASGCGKSTLLKTIAGMITPDEGSVFLNGVCADNQPPHQRGTVIVFQDLRLFPHMSVIENIAFPLKMRGVPKEEYLKTAKELLEKVQLEGYEKRRIKEMSGGQNQRVALARALAANPNVLLLDEPFSSLDENLRQDMRKLVLTLQKDYKITTILVTHDCQEALSMSDKVALMKDGKILQYDAPETIYHSPANPNVADFFGDATYVDGILKDSIFITDVGTFFIPKPDGAYQAMFRSNAVCIDEGGMDKKFQVAEINYQGADYGIVLKNPDSGLKLYTAIPSPCRLKIGDMVSVILNAEKMILFPKQT